MQMRRGGGVIVFSESITLKTALGIAAILLSAVLLAAKGKADRGK